jgi:hypothetical protein
VVWIWRRGWVQPHPCIHGNSFHASIAGLEIMDFALDTSVLPMISEKKGTLLLRSNHMKYGRATLNYNW